MIRIAVCCVQVLGLQNSRLGIEDLPMLSQLREILPPIVEVLIYCTSAISIYFKLICMLY
jgi:hypothetical protein